MGLKVPNIMVWRHLFSPESGAGTSPQIFLGSPGPFWPPASAEALPAAAKELRLEFYASAMTWVLLSTLFIGTLLVRLRPMRRAHGLLTALCGEGLHQMCCLCLCFCCACCASGDPAAFRRRRLSFAVLLHLAAVTGLALWSGHSGRLSARYGLDWEGYFLFLLAASLWLLFQACTLEFELLALQRVQKKFGWDTFSFALLSIMPYMGDPADSLKDAIFAGICLTSTRITVKILGVLALLHLWLLHGWLLWHDDEQAALGKAYFAVYSASGILEAHPVFHGRPEAQADHEPDRLLQEEEVPIARASGCKDRMPAAVRAGLEKAATILYKQSTPVRQRALLLEDVPQGLLAVMYTLLEQRLSVFVVVTNIALPAVRVLLACLVHRPLRRLLREWLVQECCREGSEELARSYMVAASEELLRCREDNEALQWAVEKQRAILGSSFSLAKTRTGPAKALLEGVIPLLVGDKVLELDLSYCSLSDAGVVVLAEAMMANASLRVLFLGDNHISDAGARALAKTLEAHKTLRRLDLGGNDISDAGAAALAEALRENGSSLLRRLDLHHNKISRAAEEAVEAALVQEEEEGR